MKVVNRTVWLGAILFFASFVTAQCTTGTNEFYGDLIVTDKDADGFPIQLGLTAEVSELPYILVSCDEGSEVSISITQPVRVKDGGPKLKGPLRSFFYYQNKIFSQDKTLILDGGFEDLPIYVRVKLNNNNQILLASDDYRYTTSLIISTKVGGPETENRTSDNDKFISSLKLKLFNNTKGAE